MADVQQCPKQLVDIRSDHDFIETVETGARLRNRVSLKVANLKQATEVIVRNHYLHRGRTMAQLPYWIQLDDNVIGVMNYSYPRMSASFMGV